MTQELTIPQVLDAQDETNTTLKKIEGHLRSIRNMLTFFTVLTILAIIVQACNILTA